MLTNYLKTTLRILRRNKLFTLINIGGLTIGLTAAFLIILFVKSEMGYDRWLPNHQRIYTIETVSTPPTRAPRTLARTARELKAAMEKDFNKIESFTRFYAGRAPIKMGNDLFPELTFRIEETFFEVFNFDFLEGRSVSALDNANSAVITEEMRQKYFPRESAIGKTFSVGDMDYSITGVLAALPSKTHMEFDFLLFNGPGALNGDFIDWTSARLYSYFLLNEESSIETVIAGTNTFLDRNAFFAPESWQDFTPSEVMGLSYLPIADIHLRQQGENPIGIPGSAALVYGFIGIAALIIIMASINFINLSTANASTREKEIAVHKVVGARSSQLMVRYLCEALTLVMIAFLLALALTELFAPAVFNWIGLSESGSNELGLEFIAIAAMASVTTGLLAGLYPAFHLSSKSPASAFSGGRSNSPRVAKFRLGLVFFQYTMSVILVIAAAHFYLQTRLATEMDLGFNDENIVSYWGVGGASDFDAQLALLERVRQVPGVLSATRMAQVPGQGSQNNVSLRPLDADTSSGTTTIQSVAAGIEFDKTMDMELIAGRSFDQSRAGDRMIADEPAASGEVTKSIIINQLALRSLGFDRAEDAVGTIYQMQDYMSEPVTVEIIGVIENAHFQTIHSEMVPMLFANADDFFNAMVVKFSGERQNVIPTIDAIWPDYVPDVAVLRTYLAEELERNYQTENQQTQVFATFAALAVIIAFMGIFGLAAFSIERRTKEVGIRKVFGATVTDIVKIFVWQYSKPVLWAIIASWPVAALMINSWLQSYAYRIDLAPLVFISAGLTVMVISWMTVASHAIRTARANPIHALRYE